MVPWIWIEYGLHSLSLVITCPFILALLLVVWSPWQASSCYYSMIIGNNNGKGINGT